jgi:hypothetical protein
LCCKCGIRPARATGKLCEECLERDRARAQRRIEAGLCRTCGKPNNTEYSACPTCLEKRRAFFRKLRLEVITAYGGARCACPGCDVVELDFLHIDHVHNDGAAHRRKIGAANLYSWLKANGFPPGFQVLCANCNLAKSRYGQCPHLRHGGRENGDVLARNSTWAAEA